MKGVWKNVQRDGAYRGGWKVCAGYESDSLAPKITAGKSVLFFKPVNLKDEP